MEPFTLENILIPCMLLSKAKAWNYYTKSGYSTESRQCRIATAFTAEGRLTRSFRVCLQIMYKYWAEFRSNKQKMLNLPDGNSQRELTSSSGTVLWKNFWSFLFGLEELLADGMTRNNVINLGRASFCTRNYYGGIWNRLLNSGRISSCPAHVAEWRLGTMTKQETKYQLEWSLGDLKEAALKTARTELGCQRDCLSIKSNSNCFQELHELQILSLGR